MRHKPVTPPAKPATPQPAGGLHFNIDRITLHGYSGAEQRRFRRALESNLSDLARSAYGSIVQEVRLKQLDAGELPAGATPETAARHIATRIVTTLSKAGSGARHA